MASGENTNGKWEKLRTEGWHLSREKVDLEIEEFEKLPLKAALEELKNVDLKNVSVACLPEEASKAGKIDRVDGPMVTQVQKVRNVAAPKANEDSQAAPRMLKLTLTDGVSSVNALELETINHISLNTPPGTKIQLLGRIPVRHGYLQVGPNNVKVLGGSVLKLIEKWEANRLVEITGRVYSGQEGGPPPFVGFGKKTSSQVDTSRPAFPSVATCEVRGTEGRKEVNDEKDVTASTFEQQRDEALQEAIKAKAAEPKKNFGGGKTWTKSHVVDTSTHVNTAPVAKDGEDNQRHPATVTSKPVYRDVDWATTVEHTATKAHHNDETDYSARGSKSGRGGRRGGRTSSATVGGGAIDAGDAEDVRPSGPATLFDFLETKFPANAKTETSKQTNKQLMSKSSSKHTQGSNNDVAASGDADEGILNNFNELSVNHFPPPPSTSGFAAHPNSAIHHQTFRPKSGPLPMTTKSGPAPLNAPSASTPKENSDEKTSNISSDYKKNNGFLESVGGEGIGKLNDVKDDSRSKKEPDSKGSSAAGPVELRRSHESDSGARQDRKDSRYGSESRGGVNRWEEGRGVRESLYSKWDHSKSARGPHEPPYPPRVHGPPPRSFGMGPAIKTIGVPSKSGRTTTPTPVSQGDTVLAKYWEDGSFYPAVINQLSRTTAVVTFIDYGNTEEVYASDVSTLDGRPVTISSGHTGKRTNGSTAAISNQSISASSSASGISSPAAPPPVAVSSSSWQGPVPCLQQPQQPQQHQVSQHYSSSAQQQHVQTRPPKSRRSGPPRQFLLPDVHQPPPNFTGPPPGSVSCAAGTVSAVISSSPEMTSVVAVSVQPTQSATNVNPPATLPMAPPQQPTHSSPLPSQVAQQPLQPPPIPQQPPPQQATPLAPSSGPLLPPPIPPPVVATVTDCLSPSMTIPQPPMATLTPSFHHPHSLPPMGPLQPPVSLPSLPPEISGAFLQAIPPGSIPWMPAPSGGVEFFAAGPAPLPFSMTSLSSSLPHPSTFAPQPFPIQVNAHSLVGGPGFPPPPQPTAALPPMATPPAPPLPHCPLPPVPAVKDFVPPPPRLGPPVMAAPRPQIFHQLPARVPGSVTATVAKFK